MRDPFTILGVGVDATDAEIRSRYLTLVREFPPDLEPDRFQAYRAAYEALADERKRLEARLLRTNEVALSRLRLGALNTPPAGPQRAGAKTVKALLAEGIAGVAAG
jgi:curved DNA-binding protein CbpA